MLHDLIVIGGGAAGFFGAIQYAERLPGRAVLILESSKQVLSKVAISGGGRCNVTHACFDPKEMVSHYPRGSKELLGPFHRFLCGDMMAWLDEHGVKLKIEEDGRVFPVSDDSGTIIDCFMRECRRQSITIQTSCRVTGISRKDSVWELMAGDESFQARQILWATGSSPAAWRMLSGLGHRIIEPVPSLFTFHIADRKLHRLAGISVPGAIIGVPGTSLDQKGAVLITHWGLSGPAVLRLSAWAARDLHERQYRFELAVNWLGEASSLVMDRITQQRNVSGGKLVGTSPFPDIPKRLWQYLTDRAGCSDTRWADLKASGISALMAQLTDGRYTVTGKSTFKEEFVTCGGVDTREVDFRTMESRLFPGLYLAGEVLNIDAITGGFNFQAAWTGAYVASQAME